MVATPQPPPLLGVLGWRLVRLIESHSEPLAKGLWERLQNCDRTSDYVSQVPPQELKERVSEIYRHLGEWLLKKTEADVEHRYVAIGERRYAQGVRLSQLQFMIVATKEHLWEFVSREALQDRPVELFQELELFQLVDQFFDRALYFAAVGFERAQTAARTH